MTSVTLTDPVAGTAITAGLFATNNASTRSAINGGIDNNNFAAGKIFDTTKIMQGGATSGQVLAWNSGSTIWLPTSANSPLLGSPVIYDRVTTALDITNTVTETTLYSKSILANDLGTNRQLRLMIDGDYLNNAGTDCPTIRVKFGATTLWGTASTVAPAASATRRALRFNVRLSNDGATNAQNLAGDWGLSDAAAGSVAGLSNIGFFNINFSGTSAIDTTANQALAVTIQWGTATTTRSWRLNYAVLELV